MKIDIRIRLFVYFIVLAASTAAENGECPPEKLIYPCVCDRYTWFNSVQTGTVKCERLDRVSDIEDVMTRSYDHPLPGLYLKEVCMLYLPSSILFSKQTQLLAIEDSVFVSLFDQVPQQENSVSNVFLLNTRLLRGVLWDFFQPFTKLKKLRIESVEVPVVGKSFRAHVSRSLTDLYMNSTKTRKIQDDAFQDLGQLSVVRIMKSRVPALKRSMFASPSMIVFFDFSDNRIQSLPADMFDNMPELYKVWLENNRITVFSEITFKEMKFGDTPIDFDLRGNSLECTCSVQWIVKRINKGLRFLGKCSSPSDMAGRELQDLTTKDFNYCPKTPTMFKF